MERIEEISKKHIRYMKNVIDSRGCCDVEDFSDDIEYLLVENKRLRDKLESVEHWLNGNRIDLAKQALKQE
jgi:uncharacterized protein YqeY